MDPETGFDQVANIGVRDGKIAKITTGELSGATIIDAKGHVVAPGFIDWHSHGQDPFAFRIYARDGLTTAMDLEFGAYPVDEFYEYWDKEGALLNCGTAA